LLTFVLLVSLIDLILVDLLFRIGPSLVYFYRVFIGLTLMMLMFVNDLLLDIDSCSLVYQDCEADALHHS